MADRKITDFLTLSALKTNTLFAVVDPDEGAAVDQNKKIPVSNMFTTFEPTFSKNTAFNKNFGGSGAATTVSRSDHEHALGDLSNFQFSGGETAGDVVYYNGSLWTNLPFSQVQSTYNYWAKTGNDIAYSAGIVTVGNTFKLTSVATDAGFATSQLLSLDTSGNVDKIAASGGGTTNFLRADGTWAAPPGGGGTPGGAVNELQKNDGASGFAGASIFGTANADLTLGTGIAGSVRTITAAGSSTPVDLALTPSGVASSIYLGQGSTSGSLFLGSSGAGGTERRINVAGSQSNINLVISAKGTGKVFWYDGTNNQEMGISDGGALTDSATTALNCSNQQQHKADWSIADVATRTLSLSNFGASSIVSIKKVGTQNCTVTVSGTGYKFVNTSNKALPATSVDLVFNSSSNANFNFEISLWNSGLLDSTDEVVFVSAI